ATAALVLLGISLPLGMVLSRMLSGAAMRAVLTLVFCWMGVFFFVMCLLLGIDLIRLVAWAVLRIAPLPELQDPSKRLLFERLLGGGVAVVAAAATGVALKAVAAGPTVTRVSVALGRLPQALDGLTIAQISDLHVAPLLGRAYVEAVVERTLALNPDLIVITGDLVDGSVAQLRDDVAPLGRLKAPHGVYFVTGNHEYYSGVDPWLDELRRLGIRPLRNERVSVGEGADSFDLAGVDDWTSRGFGGGHGPDLPRAVAGRDPARELVLLAHQPRAIFEAAEHGVGLMLSGHTHGGQLWPFGYLVRLVQPYVQGLAQHGPTQIYVNRGTGYWGPPMRLGAAPELTLLELRSGRA
ncbi:MAG TPA: metallophosphoesterase, partial [Myxococcota bacterium]|nr:metallophosphoesterase [Myxococcota bacterium]